MNKLVRFLVAAALGAGPASFAQAGGVSVGVGIGMPGPVYVAPPVVYAPPLVIYGYGGYRGYYGPGYYGPGYYRRGYYGPRYYGRGYYGHRGWRR